jgi:hypothetical protein
MLLDALHGVDYRQPQSIDLRDDFVQTMMNSTERTEKRDRWHIAVLSRDRQTLVATATVDDFEEVKAYCTVARSRDLSSKIYFKSPAGRTEEWA